MDTIGACEAKTHLSKLLERVQKGEQIMITKHGIPVAVLRPAASELSFDTKSVIADLCEFRKKHSLGRLTIRRMIEDGRR
jgi:prevent-host-death family protein